VLLIGILAIAALVWLLIAQPWSGSASEDADEPKTGTTTAGIPVPSSQAPDPTATGAVEGAVVTGGEPTPTALPQIPACTAREITVTAVTSQDTYRADEAPEFSISLTNNGADCTLNVGTSAQSFVVTSGDDTWWRSTDCQSEPSDMVVMIGAGQTVTSATPLTWDRTRSAVGTCDADTRQRAPGGGASYHLSVEIGGIASTDSAQFLLY